MKKPHILIIGMLVGLTFVLSACAPGPRVSGTPGLELSGDQAFVAYGNSLYALKANSGTVEWTYPEESKNTVLFFAQPLVVDDNVFVGDVAKTFHKIDRSNGNSVWTFTGANGYFIGQANEGHGMVFAPNNDGNLYALDLQGNLQWVFETQHFIWSQPQIGPDAVYLSSMDRFVYAISTDGKQLWAKEMAGAVVASPVLSEDAGTLFVGSMGSDFVALKTTDGQLAWSFTAQNSIWGQAILADNKLYFADTGGFLYILDPLSGAEKSRVEIGEPVIGGLIALPDGIALVTEKGNLKVLEFDGATRWEARISGNVFQSPVFSDDYLMVAAVDGDNMIYAFDVQSGAQKWSVTPKK